MPAIDMSEFAKKEAYFHVFNRGVEGKVLFGDNEDYEIFRSYLEDYLSPPVNSESVKKSFTIKGRVYKGVPHQPKNYYGKVDLLAFSLESNHFHLLLHRITEGSIENFIRSLCTRYSIYFNKKYQRSGSLFEGPYKSAQVTDISQLLHLTRYIHLCPEENNSSSKANTSYEYYLGGKSSVWIKPKTVLGFFEHSKNETFKGAGGYKKFVEEYEPQENDKKLLEKVVFKEKRHAVDSDSPMSQELAESQETAISTKQKPRIPEMIGAFAIFLLLFGIGFRNIKVSDAKDLPQPTPVVLGVEESKKQLEKAKTKLVIKILDGAESVNIRKSPSVRSEKVGQALDGEIFEFVSIDSGWYEIKLANETTGFISAKYIEVQEGVID